MERIFSEHEYIILNPSPSRIWYFNNPWSDEENTQLVRIGASLSKPHLDSSYRLSFVERFQVHKKILDSL